MTGLVVRSFRMVFDELSSRAEEPSLPAEASAEGRSNSSGLHVPDKDASRLGVQVRLAKALRESREDRQTLDR